MSPAKAKRQKSKSKRPAGRPGARGSAPAMRLWDLVSVGDQTDEAGRLLLEDSAPASAIEKVKAAGIRMDTAEAHFEDTPSRSGALTNASAYEALRRDTAEILDGFAWLGRSYLAQRPGAASTAGMLADVSHLGLDLPVVIFRRAKDPVPSHGRLPSYAASIFKASRGVYSAASDMVSKIGAQTRITAADAVRFADENGHLMRTETMRACAAPTRLIEHTIAAILAGAGGDPDASSLPEVVEFDLLWRFFVAEHQISNSLSEYSAVLERVSKSVGPENPAQLFATLIYDGDRTALFGDYTEAVLAEANAAQSKLNKILGRADKAPALGFQDLLRML